MSTRIVSIMSDSIDSLEDLSTTLLTRSESARLSPAELPAVIAAECWTDTTLGLGLGHLQANLAVVPREDWEDDAVAFLLGCRLTFEGALIESGIPPHMEKGDVPVFWGCGITPQLAVDGARSRYTFTHFAQQMFVTDRSSEADAISRAIPVHGLRRRTHYPGAAR